jgi:hypothetical protein
MLESTIRVRVMGMHLQAGLFLATRARCLKRPAIETPPFPKGFISCATRTCTIATARRMLVTATPLIATATITIVIVSISGGSKYRARDADRVRHAKLVSRARHATGNALARPVQSLSVLLIQKVGQLHGMTRSPTAHALPERRGPTVGHVQVVLLASTRTREGLTNAEAV